MPDLASENGLVLGADRQQAALPNAIALWASSTTRDGQRRADLLRDKQRIAAAFFDFIRKHPADIQPTDVQTWIAFLVRNLKRYAAEAGIDQFHLHQTRHTFARIVAEETGSIVATQDALDHKNPGTTRAYGQRISVKRDLHSGRVLRRAKRDH
jgi:integrase